MQSGTDSRKGNAVRLADFAREVGVSIVTVAKGLNNTGGKNTRVSEKTASRIRACVEKMEYHPNMLARRLVGKSSDLIGVVLDSCAPAVYHERLSLMEKYAAMNGYRFMIGQAHDDVGKLKSFAHTFHSYGVAGIICLAHTYEDANAANVFPEDSTVFLAQPKGIKNPCYVKIDAEKAFSQAVTYLVSRGRRRIAMLSLDVGYGDILLREQAYRNALGRYGFSREQIKRVPLNAMLDIDKILPLVRELVTVWKADAVICANDHLATAVLRALSILRTAVPEQVAVTGYDNLDFTALLSPPLTTFDDRRDLVAKTLVEMLLELIAEPNLSPERRIRTIEPVLIERKST